VKGTTKYPVDESMISPRVKRAWVIAGTFVTLLICAAGTWFYLLAKSHHHCMKIAGGLFYNYAEDHGGAFPSHTNGFGDALLLLVKDSPSDIPFICGPGDDGHVFSNALAHGLHVPEASCSRVYVQGLSRANDGAICLLFDRRSVRGGDHFYGRGPRLREACMVDGAMQQVSDDRWAEFSRQQVELLVAAGFPREKALEYYPQGETNAQTRTQPKK
jgi:hypothetical protein